MLRAISINNFRCFTGQRTISFVSPEFMRLASTVVISGDAGSGKSTVIYSILLIQAIARGMTRIESYGNGDPILISSQQTLPCELVVDFDCEGAAYQYGLSLSYDVFASRWRIGGEWLRAGGMVIMTRTGSHVVISGVDGGSYELDQSSFVLATFVSQDQAHPLVKARSYLAGLFVFLPEPVLFDDGYDSRQSYPYLAPGGQNLGAWMLSFLSNRMSAYPELSKLLVRHLPGFQRIVSKADATGRNRVYLMMAAGGRFYEVPLMLVSKAQKLIVLACLMTVIGELYPSIVCIWDDFDQLARVSKSLADGLCATLACQGQLIMTSHANYGLMAQQNITLP